MSTEMTENFTGDAPTPPLTPYADATRDYLAAATWLDPLADAPFITQARMVAQSLDQQLALKGELQSALSSTYLKIMQHLDRRRPAPEPAPTDPKAPSADGTASIFTQLSE